jgi:hypothetical protein
MSLGDLERKSFREIDGEFLCPGCALKHEAPQKLRCPDCGRLTTAVLQHGKYHCTHCQRELGGRLEAGIIESARPAGGRSADEPDAHVSEEPGAEEPEPPAETRPEPARPEPVRPRRRVPRTRRTRDNTARILHLTIGVLVVALCVGGAFLVRSALRRGPEDAAEETSTQPGPADPEQRIFADVKSWVEGDAPTSKTDLATYEKAVDRMQDPWLRLQADKLLATARAQIRANEDARKEALATLRAERDGAVERTEALREKAAAQAAEIATLKAELARRSPAGADSEPPDQPRGSDDASPAGTPSGSDDNGQKAPGPRAAYRSALLASQRLIAARKYGQAMDLMAQVAEEHPGTEWAKKADAERQRIRGDAYKEFNETRAKARTLIDVKDYDGARELYTGLLRFGMPSITRIVREKLAEVTKLEDPDAAPARPAGPDVPARVKKLVAQLDHPDAIQRSAAARSLGDVGAERAIRPLLRALRDKSWIVRSSAAKSLGQLKAMSAVPALIDALGDRQEAVQLDANDALKAITGQDFAQNQPDKWEAWYETNQHAGATLPPPPDADAARRYTVTIKERGYNPPTLRFSLPKDATLTAGTTVDLLRDGERLGSVKLTVVAADEAFGKLLGVAAGLRLGPLDEAVIQAPE